MDKNNDIKVNKISKWDAAPKNMGTLFTYIELIIGMACSLPQEMHDNLYDLMDKTLDEYNELEARHQKDTGMISEYEEENRNLKSELDIKTDECDDLISRVFKQDDEYTKLKEENEELRCELVADNDKLRRDRDRYTYLLDGLCRMLNDNGFSPNWDERALKWSLRKWDDAEHKWCLYDEISTCTSCRQHFEDELKIRCEEIDGKNKLIDELKQKIEDLESKNECLEFKFRTYKTFGYVGHTHLLKDKIEALEKENKDLKDTLNKDGEFGKNIGKRVADSIREGCAKGVYKLHPLTRIDIHVEETNSIPINMPFGRYAIPRISVIFNNTQTEMERDTAQHECEELEKKFKELVKENEDLRTTFALCERDANMARELCHTIAFNAERARNNKEEK